MKRTEFIDSFKRILSQLNKKKYSVIASVCRTLLGMVFIFSGAVKAIDPWGTVYKIEDYLREFGSFFIELMPMAEIAAWSLIILELLLGVCMLLNVRTRWTSWITLVFYSIMTLLTLYIARTNPVKDCGCFGDAIILSNWQTFYKNVILIVLATVLFILRKHVQPLWKGWVELVIAIVVVVGAVSFMVWTKLHLPIMDFRPYKIGNHLPTLTKEVADQYEWTFILEKDGVRKSFTIDNYPTEAGWTFIDRDSIMTKKGIKPVIEDFVITGFSDTEISTNDILESNKVTLVIIYDMNKADEKQFAKIEQLHKQCIQANESFYILTGSTTNEINDFIEQHPTLSKTFCVCDPVTLKTIVRANPGVIVLQNGTIIDKYNLRNRYN
jgi:uncharacterized membrane protein YphA (DoxX/SURF4 family)